MLRAAQNTLTGSNLGAATLEQQLVKRLYTPTGGGFAATVEDAELAVKLDAHYSETNILRLYLADVYFGDGAYGLPVASALLRTEPRAPAPALTNGERTSPVATPAAQRSTLAYGSVVHSVPARTARRRAPDDRS